MRRLLVSVCLIACLFITSGCEGTIGSLMSAIRHGWDRLHGRGPAEPDPEPGDFSKIEDVPGSPLSDEDKMIIAKVEVVRKVATTPTDDPDARENQVEAAKEKLDKAYPPIRPPLSRAAVGQAMVNLFPKQLGEFSLVEGSVVEQGRGEEDYKEELIPGLEFHTNPKYFAGSRLYQNSKKDRFVVVLIDRGNLAQWVRTAHWYYLLKGAVGSDEQQRFKFSETIQKNGRTWVVWESKQQKGEKCILFWHGRWQVWTDFVEDPEVMDAIFTSKWLDTM